MEAWGCGRIIWLLFSLAFCLPVPAQITPHTTAESRLLRESLNGREVNFGYGSDTERNISAKFLMGLISSPFFKPPGNRLTIRNAVIVDVAKYERGDAHSSLDIPIALVITGSIFEESFSCITCHFRQSLILYDDKFLKGIDINGSEISGELDLAGIFQRLPYDTRAVHMANLRVDGRVLFGMGDVQGSVEATNLKAKSIEVMVFSRFDKLILARAEILTANIDLSSNRTPEFPEELDFRGASIKALTIETPRLIETLDLSAANIGEFDVHFASDSERRDIRPVIKHLALENAVFKGDFEATGLEIDTLRANHVEIDGRALFRDVSNPTLASFEDANIGAIEWSSSAFPSNMKLGDILIHSLSMRKLVPRPFGPISASQPDLGGEDVTLDILKNATFSQSAFLAYEAALRSKGFSSEADDAYFAMREMSRYVSRKQHRWGTVVLDWIQQYVLGYGRSPVAPFACSMGLVLFGILAFANANEMEARVEHPGSYSAIWYSLELFLPIVDLGVAKEWRPAARSKWRVIYARIHQLAGWILIPVAIGSLTGLTK